jgi:hypothetical protein
MMTHTLTVDEDEMVLLIQLVQAHAMATQQDPSKAHLVSEERQQKADFDYTRKLLLKLGAARNAGFPTR